MTLKFILITYVLGYVLNLLFVVYGIVYDPRNPPLNLKLRFFGTGLIECFLWPRILFSLIGLL